MDNTRVNFDENAVVLQKNDYYPFGMRHKPPRRANTLRVPDSNYFQALSL